MGGFMKFAIFFFCFLLFAFFFLLLFFVFCWDEGKGISMTVRGGEGRVCEKKGGGLREGNERAKKKKKGGRRDLRNLFVVAGGVFPGQQKKK